MFISLLIATSLMVKLMMSISNTYCKQDLSETAKCPRLLLSNNHTVYTESGDFISKQKRGEKGKIGEKPRESEGVSASVGQEGTRRQS
jgi:hypothetical protein